MSGGPPPMWGGTPNHLLELSHKALWSREISPLKSERGVGGTPSLLRELFPWVPINPCGGGIFHIFRGRSGGWGAKTRYSVSRHTNGSMINKKCDY